MPLIMFISMNVMLMSLITMSIISYLLPNVVGVLEREQEEMVLCQPDMKMDEEEKEEEKEENEDRGKHLGGQELRLVEEDS